MRGFFAGSGSAAMNDSNVCKRVLKLLNKAAQDTSILYVGTATYDTQHAMDRQTSGFIHEGCKVSSLKFALSDPDPEEMKTQVESADIILVSGGNTLYAYDRMKAIGLIPHLTAAKDRGAVLCGGSAGCIIWFDGGHSDSADPTSFRKNMVPKEDESSSFNPDEKLEEWEYIRVPALGFLPGLCCPHYDRTQSNGVPRSVDFEGMMKRHSGEKGICVDHWAALLVDADNYEVFQTPGMQGSLMPDNSFSLKAEGLPGVWTTEVIDGEVVRKAVPPSGKIADILRPATSIVEDPRLDNVRQANK